MSPFVPRTLFCSALWTIIIGAVTLFGSRSYAVAATASVGERVLFLNAMGLTGDKLRPFFNEDKARISASLVAMVELANWTEGELKTFADSFDFPYARLLHVASGNHVGIMSKFHLKNVIGHTAYYESGV